MNEQRRIQEEVSKALPSTVSIPNSRGLTNYGNPDTTLLLIENYAVIVMGLGPQHAVHLLGAPSSKWQVFFSVRDSLMAQGI